MLAPLEHARGLPSEAYTSPSVFVFEREHLLAQAWTCVGRETELEAPGAFLLAHVAGQELLVLRGVDLELAAFHNVCRHRGLRLLDRACGAAQTLTCPYHGWSYELSGALRSAPHMPSTFRPELHGLERVRVAALHGFVFACLNQQAPALASALDGAPEWLGRGELRHVRLGRSKRYEVAANWKLVVENFQESHHFGSVHVALEALTPSATATSWLGSGAWLGGRMQLSERFRSVSMRPERAPRPFIVPEAQRGEVSDAFAFPLLLTSLQPDYLLTYSLHPESPTRTAITANTYFHPAAFRPELDADDVFELWDRVNAEDRVICERQQLGVASSAFRSAAYSLLEEGVHAFDQRMARCYLGLS